MLNKATIITLLIACAYSLCQVNQSFDLGAEYQKYLSANPINSSQEQVITELYRNLTNIMDYQVAIHSNSSIYLNNYPLCIKAENSATFSALFDVWLCLDDYYPLQCNKEWSLLIACGTFLEIHRPFDPTVLMSFNVQDFFWVKDTNNLSVTNVLLNSICAGLYHIWFVYYSRQGKFIKRVKTIYLSYPSCPC